MLASNHTNPMLCVKHRTTLTIAHCAATPDHVKKKNQKENHIHYFLYGNKLASSFTRVNWFMYQHDGTHSQSIHRVG